MMILPMEAKMLTMALVVAVSSNLDNIAIGTSIGFRKVALRLRDNAVVATVTTLGTIISAAAGAALTEVIPDAVESALGGAIMLLVGIWIVYQETVKEKPAPDAEVNGSASARGQDRSSGSPISRSELLILSLGLTLNNIPNGVGAGILHIDIWLLGSSNFLTSLLTLGVGVHVGHRGVHWVGRYAGYLAGLLLAALGATEMVF